MWDISFLPFSFLGGSILSLYLLSTLRDVSLLYSLSLFVKWQECGMVYMLLELQLLSMECMD